MLKQQLEQKLQQKLSPAQIQVIKMLEIPTLELEARIQQEIEDNPALEEGSDHHELANDESHINENDENSDDTKEDEFDLSEYLLDDDSDSTPDYKLNISNSSPDDKYEEIPFSEGISFHEHLLSQAGMVSLNESERALVEYIIGNIDDEGYLRRDAEMMVDDLAFQVGVEIDDEKMKEMIAVVQKFDPPGVGATTLQECMSIQLKRKASSETVERALLIVSKYFNELSKKHYNKILRSTSWSEDELKEVLNEISKLNPKPGRSIGGNIIEQTLSVIIPDFFVDNNDGSLSVRLNNSNVPELRVNKHYNNMLKDFSSNKSNQTSKQKDAIVFVKQKIDSARWFIDAIKQRQDTLLQTMTAIVKMQKDYFLDGDDMKLKPMILKDIADMTGLDVSTISRVSNSKYVETEFGIFPVKYFFSEKMMTDDGETVSTHEIKTVLMELVENEDKSSPMNDDMLVEALRNKGYQIARRTVAKYREQLNIPVARLRVEI